MSPVSFFPPQVGQVSLHDFFTTINDLTSFQDDLVSFHQAHFSTSAIEQFSAEFFNAEGQDQPQESPAALEDDDGLGYYADGVKRTLTDEQIAMFRHSELETLRRERENRPKSARQAEISGAEAGEIEDDAAQQSALKTETNSVATKKKKKKKGAKGKQQEPKPDLRKRTWDVVDTGLDTLEYD